jgi:hypothetical protein
VSVSQPNWRNHPGNDEMEIKESIGHTSMVDRKHPLFHIFNFVAQEYGNDPEMMVRKLAGILGMEAVEGLVKNKSWKKMLRIIRYSITAGILGAEFFMKVQRYIQFMRREKSDTSERKTFVISDLLKISKDNPLYGRVPCFTVDKSPALVTWLLSSPKLIKAKILGYYVIPTLEEITVVNLKPLEAMDLAILIEFEGNLYAYELRIRMGLFGTYDESRAHIYSAKLTNEGYFKFERVILLEFVKTLEIDKNIIKFESYGCMMYAEPRRVMNDHLNQFNVDKLIQEIEFVLENGRKRTYAFVGKQGTGKSSILRAVEQKLTKYMIVHLSAMDFKNPEELRLRFEILKVFQPLVLMIEDMESCGMKEKNNITGVFLECIDEVNEGINMVIMYTVNDTSLVHRTIINRPGRSDKVIEIYPPDNAHEALTVLETRLKRIQDVYHFSIPEGLFKDKRIFLIMDRCVERGFTQAEITNAVAEQAIIDMGVDKANYDIDSFLHYFIKAVDAQLETRKAIQNCNFKNEDPDQKTESISDGNVGIGISEDVPQVGGRWTSG